MKIKNWQHLCIFGRIASTDIEIDGKTILHDGKLIRIQLRDEGCNIDYFDVETNELLLTQGEDGFPTYTSEWAEQMPNSPYEIA